MSDTKKSLHDFYETRVKDIMQTSRTALSCIEENADVDLVFSLLNKKDHVWVINSKNPLQVLGVITKSDTIALLSPPVVSLQTFDKPDPRSLQFGVALTAGEIMSKNPITSSPDETVREIIIKMKQHNIQQLPVVDENGIFLGDITLQQLINRYSKMEP